MAVANAQRILVKILHETAQANGVRVESLGEGWIYQLTRGEVIRHVYGYSFDLNTAATHQIACDKCATSEVLSRHGLPHVPHQLFLHPEMAKMVPHKGNWGAMLEYCTKHGWDVVAKENSGTGGRGVVRVRDAVQLERAVYSLFARTTSVALCPYRNASKEIRFIMLAGSCELAFAKVRPSVFGDGQSTALELLASRIHDDGGVSGEVRRLLENLEEDVAHALGTVPPAGAEFLVNWRHNLGQGAAVELLNLDTSLEDVATRNALALAEKAARAINLTFGSIDILMTNQGPEVLEVNAGVMMEFLATSITGGKDAAARVYTKAFDLMFR